VSRIFVLQKARKNDILYVQVDPNGHFAKKRLANGGIPHAYFTECIAGDPCHCRYRSGCSLLPRKKGREASG
jgi:hypothetical protein